MPRRFHLLRRNHASSTSTPSSNEITNDNNNHNDQIPDPTSRVKNRLHALFTHNSYNDNPCNDGNEKDQLEQEQLGNEAGPSHFRNSRLRSCSRDNKPEINIQIQNETQGYNNGNSDHISSQDFIKSKTFPLDKPHGNRNNSNNSGMAQTLTIPKTKQRDAIKVLMVTWNMGDALPKGDLSVLFGQIPPYQPASPTDNIPKLPVENTHPYHIVVVAGQECPTTSGAPRGLGGGLVKGVTIRHRKEKEKEKEKEREREKEKEKEREKEKEKEKEKELGENKDDVQEKTKETDKADEKEQTKPKEKEKPDLRLRKDTLDVDREDAGSRSADQDDSSEDETPKESSDNRSRANSPMTPHTPFLHRNQPASKGWSQMLDDYFCGPNARTSEPIPNSYNSSSPIPRDTPFLPHPAPSAFPAHPSLLRSASAPITPVASPITIPPRTPAPLLGTSNLVLSPSPLARSRSSFESTSASSSNSNMDESFLMMNQNSEEKRKDTDSSPKRKIERPEIVIPNDEITSTNSGNGSYVHVVKERLLGMYLSVYVYKGCEHLIQGLDKDLVTAGLAGGRVGNKGGIGISLKLADHTFLFVNSHLAAHTGRMHARLSNIAKIKEELRLDCFLPKDDPRAAAEDITDRFDTVFWCGDLNFRIELSRLHADWLIEQKKYSELLMWDQLKLAMKDPNLNPFPGFEEGPIDFPCTFKYDVWKSVRSTNREIRKTLKRRKSSASAVSIDMGSSVNVSKNLSYVPEGDAIEEVEGDDENPDVSPTHDRFKRIEASDDDMTEGDFSRRSFESSRYTSGAGTDVDEDSDDMPMTYKNQHQHRPFEVALKEKTKQFLGLVKMDGILTPTSSRRGMNGMGRKVSVKRKISIRRKPKNDDYFGDSRRTSVSSFVSQPDTDRPSTPPTGYENNRRVSTSSRYDGSNEGGQDIPNNLALAPPSNYNRSDSGYSSSPPRDRDKDKDRSPPAPFTRRLSLMKRTMSNKSVNNVNAGDDEDEEEIIDEIDRREGVYDTSKKQRVPSWCDRVLWKAHIIPDPEDEPSPAPSVDIQIDSHTPFHRLSNVFSNLGGHLKLQMGRTSSMEPGPSDRLNLRIRNSASPDGKSTPPRTDNSTSTDTSRMSSPPDSPTLSPLSLKVNSGEGLIPLPRRASPLRPTSESPSRKEDQRHLFINSSAPPSRSPTKLIPSLGIGMIRSGSVPGQSRPNLANRPVSASGNLPTLRSTSQRGSPRIPITNGPEKDMATNQITFDSPQSQNSDRLEPILNYTGERPRRNSDSVGIEISAKANGNTNMNGEKKKGRMSDGILRRSTGDSTDIDIDINSNRSSPDKKSSLKIFNQDDRRIKTISQSSPTEFRPKNLLHPSQGVLSNNHIHRTTTIHTPTNPSTNTTNGTGTGVERERESDKNAFMRFLKDLPSWLHRSSSGGGQHDKNDDNLLITIENQQEEKWRKGEVRCLHYGTIDDSGMRQLEGRSDHRPAIFAGAVYV